jgi:hypothetical protein
MINPSPIPSQRGLLLAAVLGLVLVVIPSATDPDFLLALKQTPWTVALNLTVVGGVMYCIIWLFEWHRRIPKEPEPPWRVALVPIGFVGGGAIGTIYGIVTGDWPLKFGLALFFGGGLSTYVALILRGPKDALPGACAGVLVAIAELIYRLIKLWQNAAPDWDARGLTTHFAASATIYAIVGALPAVYLLRILRFRKQVSAASQPGRIRSS